MSDTRVCVTGAGLVSCLGPTLAATHAALRAGVRNGHVLLGFGIETARALRGHPMADLDPSALAVGPGEARGMSAAMRALQAAARGALVQAGLAGDRRRLASFGISMGAHSGERTSQDEIAALERATDADGRLDAARYGEALLARAPRSALKAQPGLLAGMLALVHGVQGPCITVIDDGVAGARAVAEAYHAIADRWCERWIVGAAFDLDDPWILLTRGRYAPALGSAAAVLVLESEDAARRRDAPVRATLEEHGALHGEGETGDLAASFAALRIAERLGDTLAAAVPVALALAVYHLDATSGERAARARGDLVCIAPAGAAPGFLVRAAANGVPSRDAEEADGARAEAGALDAC